MSADTTDGGWVIVLGELDTADNTGIRLHHITLDGEPRIPVFANPDAARRALAGSPAADNALRITLALLRETLAADTPIIFDDGVRDPVRLTLADLRPAETDNA